jgi:hypothetical protein
MEAFVGPTFSAFVDNPKSARFQSSLLQILQASANRAFDPRSLPPSTTNFPGPVMTGVQALQFITGQLAFHFARFRIFGTRPATDIVF